MSISDKIEKIRQQPEHIRLRWAWGLAALITFAIAVIWMFSFKFQPRKNSDFYFTNDQKDFLNEFQDQTESLKNAADELKNISEKSVQAEN